MRKEILIHFLAFLVFFLITVAVNSWFEVRYTVFLLGGILGTILPDFDQLVYVYFLHPQDLSSQRVNHMLSEGRLWSTLNFFADTRTERKQLIFHTFYFELLVLALIVFVLTSSASLFGKGVILGFGLHLLVDQFLDFNATGTIVNWFSGNVSLVNFFDRRRTIYLFIGAGLLLLIFAVLL